MEARESRDTGATAELTDSDAAAAFAPPSRRLVSIKPATLLFGSVVTFFVGVRAGAALDSALLYVAAIGLAFVGAALSTVGALRQLLRHVRDERRDGDHSLLVLLLVILAGTLCAAAVGFWATLSNTAD